MTLQLSIAASSGNGAYLTCYPATGLVNTTAAQTMMYWVNPPTNTPGSGAGGTASSNIGLYNGTPNASTSPTSGIQMGICQGGTVAGTVCVWTWGGTNLVTSAPGYVLPTNTWTHIAYSCTTAVAGSQTHSLYINGVLNNTSTNTLQVAVVPDLFYFNGYPVTPATTGPESNNMQMDDIYYFNRQLSAAEVLTIYTSMGQRDGITYGLVARYNFNERVAGSAVVRATDFSGNNNTVLPVVVGTGTAPTYNIDWANEDSRPVQ